MENVTNKMYVTLGQKRLTQISHRQVPFPTVVRPSAGDQEIHQLSVFLGGNAGPSSPEAGRVGAHVSVAVSQPGEGAAPVPLADAGRVHALRGQLQWLRLV